MSILGNITAAGKPAAADSGLTLWGWDGDLAAVPEFTPSVYAGSATDEQVLAGLYIEGGALVVDSDLMVAAGADELTEVRFYIDELNVTTAYAAWLAMDIEDLATGSGYRNAVYLRVEVRPQNADASETERCTALQGGDPSWGEYYVGSTGNYNSGLGSSHYKTIELVAGGLNKYGANWYNTDAAFTANDGTDTFSGEGATGFDLAQVSPNLGLGRHGSTYYRGWWKIHRFKMAMLSEQPPKFNG